MARLSTFTPNSMIQEHFIMDYELAPQDFNDVFIARSL
jgi:hypothetical protein